MPIKIIYYYQTFNGLAHIIKDPYCTHIHISSIHFGIERDNITPYIHLNDMNPTDPCFDDVWKEAETLSKIGVKIVLMMGGAGGAFEQLFKNFDVYYALFKQTLLARPFITGIDLNVEENVGLQPIIKLISKIKEDFPTYNLSMAPIQHALTSRKPGMGGFKYTDLLKTPQGKQIDYFNGQFYIDYSLKAFKDSVNNGFDSNKIVMGMLSSQYNPQTISSIRSTLETITKFYPEFGGVFIWEQFDSYSNNGTWDYDMDIILNKIVT